MTEHETRDLAFAAYLLMRKHPFVRVEQKGRYTWWVFTVEDPDGQKRDYLNSESREFFQAFSELKNTLAPGQRGSR